MSTASSSRESSRSISTESCVSTTTTIRFGLESFESLAPRARKLAAENVWPGSKAEDITVSKMTSGGFNRIIGLERKGEEVIIRIPHCVGTDINADVRNLDFVRWHTTLPLPEVVSVEDKTDNDLNSEYSVQRLLPGGTLLRLYPGLTHSQKCQVARELGNAMKQMLAVKSSIAGRISGQLLSKPSAYNSTFFSTIRFWIKQGIPLKWMLGKDSVTIRQSYIPQSTFHIEPLLPRFDGLTEEETDRRFNDAGFGVAYSDPLAAKPYQAQAPKESTLDLLTALCKIHKANNIRRCPLRAGMPHLMDRLSRMAEQLATQGWLDDRSYSLCHLDFHPRNILINPGAAQIISGIIDWDSALFLPTFMGCQPPMWLWAWNDEDDEDERQANEVPPTREGQEIKGIFEEAAGDVYLKFAYAPSYRLGRQLVKYIIEDVRCVSVAEDVGEMLDEWDRLCSETLKE